MLIRIAKRVILTPLEIINQITLVCSMGLAQITGKTKFKLHPKHLIDNPHHRWYLDYISRDDKVLDLGCGSGIHAIYSGIHCKYVVAIDYNKKNIEIAEKLKAEKGIDNISFLYQSIESENMWKQFEDESFDKILLLDVLEHLNRRKFVLDEIRRILDRRGKFLLTAPNRLTSHKIRKKNAGLFYYSDRDHKIEYTIEEIKNVLKETGFEIANIQPIVYDSPFYGLIDLIGGISLKWYRKLMNYKIAKVKKFPNETTGFRIVARRRD